MDTVIEAMSAPSIPIGEAVPCGVECGHERKFVATPDCAAALLDRLATRLGHDATDPGRPVTYNRTTYLDTAGFLYLRSSQSGLARKLRIREYAAAPCEGVVPVLHPVCFLELKESRGGLRAKTRLRTDPASLARLLAGEDARKLVVDPFGAFATLCELLERDRPVPTVTSWYRRTTRVNGDRSLRVTVDSGVCYTEPVVPGTAPSSAFPETSFGRIPFSIVEVKSDGDVPAWLLAELASLTEVRDFSKFEQGMALLLPGETA